MLVMSVAISSAVAEDTLIDALRGCQTVDHLLQLRDQLEKNSDNPALFDWICRLLVARRDLLACLLTCLPPFDLLLTLAHSLVAPPSLVVVH